MSSPMAVATKERPASVRRTNMDFWDGTGKHTRVMRSITAKERTAIWDAVAGYIQEQLLLRKGVRVPTLGSFDVLPTRTQVGNEALIIQRPVFRLARNLTVVHNLTDDKDYQPGHKELEPMKSAKVAVAAFVPRQKVEGCVRGTTSLISYCLEKGENIALVLKGIGLLLIEGRRVEMKFYPDFLERLSGKRMQQGAALKVPQLLSRMLPIASLTFRGRVIVFPEFELELVPKRPPRDPLKTSRNGPAEDKLRKKEGLLPVRQDQKGRLAELPAPAQASLIKEEIKTRKAQVVEKWKKNWVMQLPTIPEEDIL